METRVADQISFLEENTFNEVEDQVENLQDVENVSQKTVVEAVVSGNDWTTETIISQINKGNIQLNPSFQRRDAWEGQRKSRFIESLILGLPIPQLVLAESRTRRGSYIVIDGKQRLLSIRQFAAEDDDQIYQPLKLSGLSIRDDLHKLTLKDLKDNPDRLDDLSSFENQPIRTVVIRNWGSEEFLYQVFLRLNTGSVPLSPQELRQALHPGPFVEFADVASGDSVALRSILKLKRPDFRMRDTELLIRWYALQYFAEAYTGDLKAFMDRTCKDLNARWTDDQDEIVARLGQFEEAHKAAHEVFGKNVYRKWASGGYETRFNRAIFDVLLYYFADPEVRAATEGRGPDIEASFKELCENDVEFRASIEQTTKSIGAMTTRLSRWADRLNNALNLKLSSPLTA